MRVLYKLLWSSLLLLFVGTALPQVAEKTVDLAIVNGKVAKEKRVIKLSKGDSVRLRFSSDMAGDVHLHAYRLQTRVGPDKPGELAFKAHATGKFRFEWHEAKQQNKAPAGGGHHAEALATLEVRPN
jgi:hypothetical protein